MTSLEDRSPKNDFEELVVFRALNNTNIILAQPISRAITNHSLECGCWCRHCRCCCWHWHCGQVNM